MTPPQQIFDRKLLTLRRDRIAARAHEHDFLLRLVADDLMDRLAVIRRTFAKALVLGAHHGLLGRRLRLHPGTELVIEADLSPRMLARCGEPRLVADEEALPFAEGSLDLVVSGLTLQHVNDLPGTLLQIRRALRPDGLFLATMLGGTTLYELREVFLAAEAELEGGASPRVAPFADVRDLGSLLQRAGFALPVADADTVTVTYASLLDLMRELRGMGAGNVLAARRRAPLRRATLARCMEVYAERFPAEGGRIRATFELLTMTAWAPDASQQKPLRPGSASRRLAEALGVTELGTTDASSGGEAGGAQPPAKRN